MHIDPLVWVCYRMQDIIPKKIMHGNTPILCHVMYMYTTNLLIHM